MSAPARWLPTAASAFFLLSIHFLTLFCSDASIKLVNTLDARQLCVFPGHTRDIRSLSFDPRGTFLLSSSSDGSVRVWTYETDRQACEKTIANAFPPPSSSLLCRVDWHPSGRHFAVSGSPDVPVYERDTWQISYTLGGGQHSAPVSLVSFSPNGRYLASADADGILVVWRVDDRSAVVTINTDGAVTDLAWDPIRNAIALVSENAVCSILRDIVPASMPHPAEKRASAIDATGSSAAALAKSLFESAATDGGDGDENGGGDDDEDEGSELDDDELGSLSGFIDDGGAKRRKNDAGGGAAKEKKGASGALAYFSAAQQPAFMPSASLPGQKRRYLAWNLDGIIVLRDENTHNAVEIELHDRSAMRPIHFKDHANISMGTLSTQMMFL